MKTIGLIGGTGWVSTVEYYRQINEKVNARLGGLQFAKILLHSFNYGEIDQLNRANDQEAIYKKLLLAAQGLILSGAEGLALCANTMHLHAAMLSSQVNIPLVHIGTVAAETAWNMGIQKIAVVGTQVTMEAAFYKKEFTDRNIEVLVPGLQDRKRIHQIINEELIKSIFLPETRKEMTVIFDGLKAQGAQAIVLACTEIPLLISRADYDLPLLNSLHLHTEAIVDFIIN